MLKRTGEVIDTSVHPSPDWGWGEAWILGGGDIWRGADNSSTGHSAFETYLHTSNDSLHETIPSAINNHPSTCTRCTEEPKEAAVRCVGRRQSYIWSEGNLKLSTYNHDSADLDADRAWIGGLETR